jgi:molybdopterin/thiamine biosynthesis adenylyltransferase
MSKTILRLQSSWSCLPNGEGGLALVSTVRHRRILLGGQPDRVGPAVKALAEGVDADAAAGSLARASKLSAPEAQRLVEELQRAGVLVRRRIEDDVSSFDAKALYDRQIRFLSLFESGDASGIELNRRLQHRKVVIPGLGGTGGWLALLCARLGIRNIVVIDMDVVELSNLHRQILYRREDLGKPKVEACAGQMLGIDDEIRLTGHAICIKSYKDVVPLIEGADLVINAFPPFDPNFAVASRAMSEAALRSGVPCLQMPAAQCVGPLTVPGKTACFRCAEPELRERFGYAPQVAPPWWRMGFIGAMAPRQALTGGLAVWEAVRFLSGMDRPPSLDGALWIDIGAYSQHGFIRIPRRPECEECGSDGQRRRKADHETSMEPQ